ncbi:cytochrome P450 [Streptomyces sp. NPDC048291]|uniref:cytochrome P450 n=1 Tax=Streptomyces sp. NPDC048291 TaxID=3365530 RepID=UPI00371351D7
MTTETAPFPFPPLPPEEALEAFRKVRADRPMTKVTMPYGGDVWVIHRHAAAKKMLEDRRFVRQPFRGEREVPYFVQFPPFLLQTFQWADPPEHTRLRRLVARAFTARRVEQLRQRAQEMAQNLLDRMTADGRTGGDFAQEFATPFPIRVLCELIGVPEDDRDRFIGWSHALLAVSGMTEEEILQNSMELYGYLAALIARRRAEPLEDLLSLLAVAEEKDDSLTDEEILPIAMLILVGGFDNTANFITHGVRAMLHNPEHLKLLLTDIDGIVPTLVEETLRHAGFVMGTPVAGGAGLPPHMASEDVEIDGRLIRAGECVLVDISAANHDENAFADPHVFDITRKANPHLTLSHGLHHCLGAPLARMEIQVALSAIFRRLPRLRLTGEAVDITETLTGGISSLPVAW